MMTMTTMVWASNGKKKDDEDAPVKTNRCPFKAQCEISTESTYVYDNNQQRSSVGEKGENDRNGAMPAKRRPDRTQMMPGCSKQQPVKTQPVAQFEF